MVDISVCDSKSRTILGSAERARAHVDERHVCVCVCADVPFLGVEVTCVSRPRFCNVFHRQSCRSCSAYLAHPLGLVVWHSRCRAAIALPTPHQTMSLFLRDAPCMFRRVWAELALPSRSLVRKHRFSTIRAMGDLDDAFEFAVALVAAPAGADGQVVGLDDLGEDFEHAANLLVARPVSLALGMRPRSKATAAFARQCLATQRAESKLKKCEATLAELTERPLSCNQWKTLGVVGGRLLSLLKYVEHHTQRVGCRCVG